MAARWFMPPRQRRFWIRFACNLVLGIAIEMIVMRGGVHSMFLDEVKWLQDLGVDTVTRARAALSRPDDGRADRAVPLVFIDVDERTWADTRWGGGEPAEAPRDGLLALARFTFERQAATVVFDVLVDHATPTADDLQLASGLSALVSAREQAANTSPAAPRLVLVRSPQAPPADADVDESGPNVATIRALRPSALDALVDSQGASSRRVVETVPGFVQSKYDRVMRDWSPQSVVCRRTMAEPDGRVVLLPSVQIAALAGASAELSDADAPWFRRSEVPCPPAGDGGAAARIRREFEEQAAQWAARQPMLSEEAPPEAGAPEFAHRIAFRTGDSADPVGRRFHGADAVVHLSALDVLVRPSFAMAALSPVDWKRAIVVIGQSHSRSGDNFLTPLGDMPGSLVIINSIDSLARFGPIRVAEQVDWVFTVVSLAACAALVSWFGGFAGFLFSSVAILLLGIASLVKFGSGMWIDFTLPLVGMIVVEIVDHVRHWLSEHRHEHHP